jgi:hypothetical protein
MLLPDVIPLTPEDEVILAADADVLYEVVNGQRLGLPAMGAFETDVASTLAIFLGLFCRTHRLEG